MQSALFPLNSVIGPGGRLPLQIFEPRYLDMLATCMKQDKGFVVVTLKEGGETSRQAARFYHSGCYSRIVDFNTTDNGMLAVTVEGLNRVNIDAPDCQDDGLWIANICNAEEEAYVALPRQYDELRHLLETLLLHPMVGQLNLDIDFEDGRQVGWRLTELLPFDKRQKQELMDMDDPVARLEEIRRQLVLLMV